MNRHVVGKAPDMPPGSHKIVEVAGRHIGVFNVNGEFFALLNRCPHGGAELCKGAVVGLVQPQGVGEYTIVRKGEFIRCPFHGWEFEIKTGQSYCAPNRLKIRSFDVTVQSGDQLVKGPYVAESYDVRVEDDYVVVTL
ncbi:Rieske (2Fe-2S) protein [Bradyrhizobium canariense]|uniref:Assimilatory nitrite reductase (NAD(P)H) small subunit n=1 Tax=Bradyrhizobium canariense TaxID=255045 RepID=A0A1H2B7E3_9BRAD|nr:Rieske (2Fe-2S) protein [Bradyrhizobium canariense]SDT53706.1 assimilatory nitrite reductase (NAD(P)H) small subunit [Bradyrhizobium canariense]